MAQSDKIRRREEAAEFWNSHEVTFDNSQEVTESIQVRRPLTAMISIRLSDDDLSKLKMIARAQDVGVTTMARMLLHQCIDDPAKQLMPQALQTKQINEELSDVLDDAKVPLGEGPPEFLVLSKAHLDRISQVVTQTAIQLLSEGLREQSVSITPSQGEIFDKLSEMGHCPSEARAE